MPIGSLLYHHHPLPANLDQEETHYQAVAQPYWLKICTYEIYLDFCPYRVRAGGRALSGCLFCADKHLALAYPGPALKQCHPYSHDGQF